MFERFNVSGLTPARTDAGGHRSRLTTQNGYAGGRQEATEDPAITDIRNFYEVELWTRDDQTERMLFARTSLDKARNVC
jgi:hypothetical protein